ncbi:MAG: EFR1 family ferrodoxin [Methanoculleus sp.]
MKTIIYYFTGTGNSLAAAKKITASLGETRLIPIASLADTPAPITPAAERVGIVCPVYDFGLPVMVAGFAERLDLSQAKYAFAVVTMGGLGVSALHQLDGILSERGRGLDAAFAVRMPGNFPPLSRPPGGRKRDEILTAGDMRLGEIVDAIGRGCTVRPGFEPFSGLMKTLTYGSFVKDVHRSGERFSASDACTGCGTCAAVCPVGNIDMADGRPVWGRRCEGCCACLHFCSAEAIQLDVMFGTEGRGRYRHPDVTIADMERQRKGTITPPGWNPP